MRHCQSWPGREGRALDFDELLDRHKREFDSFRALIVLDEKNLRRYVLCWGPHLVQRRHSYPLADTLKDLWQLLAV